MFLSSILGNPPRRFRGDATKAEAGALVGLIFLVCAFIPQPVVGDDLEAAIGLLEDARFAEASELSLSILDKSPQGGPLYSSLMIVGITAMVQDHFEEASMYFSQANHEFPEKKGSLLLLGILHFRHDRYAEAKRFLEEAGYLETKEIEDLIGLMGNRSPFVLASEGTAVQVELGSYRGLPTVSVRINGIQANFLVDTGSEYVVIDPSITTTTSKSLLQALSPNVSQSSWAIVDTLALRGLQIHNVPARILDLSTMRAVTGEQILGILGASFFYHFVNEFDFLNRRITLKPKIEAFGTQSGDPLMLASDYVPFATGTINGHQGPLIIDTGIQDYGVVIQEATANELGVQVGRPSAALVEGGIAPVMGCSLGEVTVGGATYLSPKGGIARLNIPDYGFRIFGMLGYASMEGSIVTMDYANMRFSIQKRGQIDPLNCVGGIISPPFP